MDSVEKEDSLGMARLGHPAEHFFVFRRNVKKDIVVVRRIQGNNNHFQDHLRLKAAMFNHHMPWGYNALFDGYGTAPNNVSLEQFEDILKIYKSNCGTSLYPNLENVKANVGVGEYLRH